MSYRPNAHVEAHGRHGGRHDGTQPGSVYSCIRTRSGVRWPRQQFIIGAGEAEGEAHDGGWRSGDEYRYRTEVRRATAPLPVWRAGDKILFSYVLQCSMDTTMHPRIPIVVASTPQVTGHPTQPLVSHHTGGQTPAAHLQGAETRQRFLHCPRCSCHVIGLCSHAPSSPAPSGPASASGRHPCSTAQMQA